MRGTLAFHNHPCVPALLTTLILENVLAAYTPEEAVALLSIFVFVEKTDSHPEIPPKLIPGLETIYRIANDVEKEQDWCRVGYEEFKEKFKIGLVEVVYEWARGMVSPYTLREALLTSGMI
jgi:antiviral helicase SKI2